MIGFQKFFLCDVANTRSQWNKLKKTRTVQWQYNINRIPRIFRSYSWIFVNFCVIQCSTLRCQRLKATLISESDPGDSIWLADSDYQRVNNVYLLFIINIKCQQSPVLGSGNYTTPYQTPQLGSVPTWQPALYRSALQYRATCGLCDGEPNLKAGHP